VFLLALLAFSSGARAGEQEDQDLAVARRARPAIVRVEWRSGVNGSVVERQAIVVDPDGWLLLAGPRPGPGGTLAVLLDEGRRAMRAEVWASDAATCLSLLRVQTDDLPSLQLRTTDHEAGEVTRLPERLPPGFRFVMVTAEGAVAEGTLRANHRTRKVQEPGRGEVKVDCLDEAALATVSEDMGAPWLDAKGHVVGLLVGAETAVPPDPTDGSGLHFRPRVVAAHAVPAAVAAIVWPLLRDERRVPRAALGALTSLASDALTQQVCRGCGGHVVKDLAPGGPAAQAGLNRLDLIRTVDGHPLSPRASLSDVLLPYRPGDTVRLGILRSGKPLELPVVLSEAR
jgi:S1-C subfamily serine protease